MRILLTGATGLIGSALAPKLLASGHELTVLTRSKKKFGQRFPFPCRTFVWNAPYNEPPLEAFEGVTAIVHLAGQPVANKRWNDALKKSVYDSRVVGTKNLLAAAEKSAAKIKLLIGASAIGYYGNLGDTRATESRGGGDDFLARTCRDWEAAYLDHAIDSLRTCVLRIGVVLSSEGGMLRSLHPIFRRGFGGKLGSGNQWMSWIHIEDMIATIMHCLERNDLSGVFNATSPEPVTNKNFTKQLSKTLHRSARFPVPKFAVKFVFGELAEMVFASQRIVPQHLVESGFKFRFSSLAEALDNIFARHGADNLLVHRQWIAKDQNETFSFFSETENLEKITPASLKFRVVGKSTDQIQSNTLIDYKLRLHGLPIRWQSKILEWNPVDGFVDTQTKGPYSIWHHTHTFEPLAGGTLITDRVHYRVPGGLLGTILIEPFVKADVRRIFKHRFKCIEAQLAPTNH